MRRIQPHLDNMAFPPPLQHASRKGVNNVMASFVVNESINHHTEKGGKVFACLLDIEKCFDSIWWAGLLYKMHDIGLDNKLWHLMLDWLIGSKCRVTQNGQISDTFALNRSIKQGGILSMLNLCIFMHDIHQHVDAYYDLGLYCGDLYVGSVAYADDIMLMSSCKGNLDQMMYNAWDYSRKWRFSFSPSKSKCMVFGESERTNIHNRTTRQFHVGEQLIQEVTHYDHLGVMLCSYDSSVERTNAACTKGARTMASLSPCGLVHTRLYPFTSAFIWNRICIPAMLHGCELWHSLRKYEMDMLERTQCRALRGIQGLPPRTHNVITRGLLGELSMDSRMCTMKLMFLFRLAISNPCFLVKRIFLRRLYDHLLHGSMKGFIPDIARILDLCSLKDYLFVYMCGGQFPSKLEWKQLVKQAVNTLDYEFDRKSLLEKRDCSRYVRCMTMANHGSLHPLYTFTRHSDNVTDARSMLAVIRCLGLPEAHYDNIPCKLCNKEYADIVRHAVAECPALYEERNTMWDYIIDNLDVQRGVDLACKDDEQFADFLCGAKWTGFENTCQADIELFYFGLVNIFVKHFFKCITSNYEWFR